MNRKKSVRPLIALTLMLLLIAQINVAETINLDVGEIAPFSGALLSEDVLRYYEITADELASCENKLYSCLGVSITDTWGFKFVILGVTLSIGIVLGLSLK